MAGINIYYYGCNCGVIGTYIRQVKRYAHQNNIEVALHNSKYDEAVRSIHAMLLADNNLPADSYLAIVEYDNHVEELSKWLD